MPSCNHHQPPLSSSYSLIEACVQPSSPSPKEKYFSGMEVGGKRLAVGSSSSADDVVQGISSGDQHELGMMVEEELRRGPWTVEEDFALINYVSTNGEGRWNSLARSAGLKRTGKSCRLRWLNYLRPDVRRGNITVEEQLVILELHSRWGNRWSKIAQHLPGRTDNEIKNYWRTRVQKHAKQLHCDVNSQQFKDTMGYLLERSSSSPSPSPLDDGSSSRTQQISSSNYYYNNTMISTGQILQKPTGDDEDYIMVGADPMMTMAGANSCCTTFGTDQQQIHDAASDPNHNYYYYCYNDDDDHDTSNYYYQAAEKNHPAISYPDLLPSSLPEPPSGYPSSLTNHSGGFHSHSAVPNHHLCYYAAADTGGNFWDNTCSNHQQDQQRCNQLVTAQPWH